MPFPFLIGAAVAAVGVLAIGAIASAIEEQEKRDKENALLQAALSQYEQASQDMLAEKYKSYKELGELNQLKQEIIDNELQHVLDAVAKRSRGANSKPFIKFTNLREGYNVDDAFNRAMSLIEGKVNNELATALRTSKANLATQHIKNIQAEIKLIRKASKEVRKTLKELRKIFHNIRVGAKASSEQFDLMLKVAEVLTDVVNISVVSREGLALPDIEPICHKYLRYANQLAAR